MSGSFVVVAMGWCVAKTYMMVSLNCRRQKSPLPSSLSARLSSQTGGWARQQMHDRSYCQLLPCPPHLAFHRSQAAENSAVSDRTCGPLRPCKQDEEATAGGAPVFTERTPASQYH